MIQQTPSPAPTTGLASRLMSLTQAHHHHNKPSSLSPQHPPAAVQQNVDEDTLHDEPLLAENSKLRGENAILSMRLKSVNEEFSR
jgi:hypothetical protein